MRPTESSSSWKVRASQEQREREPEPTSHEDLTLVDRIRALDPKRTDIPRGGEGLHLDYPEYELGAQSGSGANSTTSEVFAQHVPGILLGDLTPHRFNQARWARLRVVHNALLVAALAVCFFMIFLACSVALADETSASPLRDETPSTQARPVKAQVDVRGEVSAERRVVPVPVWAVVLLCIVVLVGGVFQWLCVRSVASNHVSSVSSLDKVYTEILNEAQGAFRDRSDKVLAEVDAITSECQMWKTRFKHSEDKNRFLYRRAMQAEADLGAEVQKNINLHQSLILWRDRYRDTQI